MTVVTITAADILALGGSLPLSGFMQVWALTPIDGQIDQARAAEYRLADGEITLGAAPVGGAILLVPRGVRGLTESWAVTPPTGPIGLADLIAGYRVDVSTLLPLPEIPPSVAEILVQVEEAGRAVVLVAASAAGSASAAGQSAADAASARQEAIDAAARVPTEEQLTATFVASNPTLIVTYNGDSSVASTTENGVLTTFTYNTDGTVKTQTRSGTTRTFTYDANGNVTGAN
ncbi:hypothetical protein [Cryobacterium arcticum]|uniref:RHS repeat protein n=1 Tax=Cryobacterium arcticum TaxID=670052 RepID=A0A1B1BQ99_9MICO|nr:hypothetical protein [Cryobacterium arcticum]ANP74553.1 hypothetical protein PA27867_3635 [Cryobacterium arcticum]